MTGADVDVAVVVVVVDFTLLRVVLVVASVVPRVRLDVTGSSVVASSWVREPTWFTGRGASVVRSS